MVEQIENEGNAMMTWQVGRFNVTGVQEFPIAVGSLDGLIAEGTPELVRGIDWMYPEYATESGQTLWDVMMLGTHFTGIGAGYIVEDAPGLGLTEARSA